MANPFQDKFLKAGLATKKQVHKAKVEQNRKRKKQRRNPGNDPTDKAVELALQRRKEQSRQGNVQRDQAAREKEVAAQVKQLAAANRVDVGKGDIAFHFSDSSKIKKMYLPSAVIDKLSSGTLGIVKVADKYEIVPAEAAGKIRDRCPEALLVLNDNQTLDPDDPYAEFPIPDDFEW
ncbi:MAG: DUF2058 domain-containing protein [Thermodesulfobacteriota bacterium]